MIQALKHSHFANYFLEAELEFIILMFMAIDSTWFVDFRVVLLFCYTNLKIIIASWGGVARCARPVHVQGLAAYVGSGILNVANVVRLAPAVLHPPKLPPVSFSRGFELCTAGQSVTCDLGLC